MSSITILRMDAQILTINKVICRHIDSLATTSRGVVLQDILSQFRNFVQHVCSPNSLR